MALLHGREFLKSQRVDPAEQGQSAFRLLEAALLLPALEGDRIPVGDLDHLVGAVFGHQVVDGEAVLLEGLPSAVRGLRLPARSTSSRWTSWVSRSTSAASSSAAERACAWSDCTCCCSASSEFMVRLSAVAASCSTRVAARRASSSNRAT